jgi:glycosyltransferase involved in cell wall biosynthesis
MRILFVALGDSVHTARWINQITDQKWDLHLFPVNTNYGTFHSSLHDITIHEPLYHPSEITDETVHFKGLRWPSQKYWLTARAAIEYTRFNRIQRLTSVIRSLKPDIIHSLGIQHGGYITLDAKQRSKGSFPRWIVTNWGSDIYLFGRLPYHKERIQAVLRACDYYSCETQRDIGLGLQFGFEGKILAAMPNTGGFDLAKLEMTRNFVPTSFRKILLIKGYQNFAGRALVALRAVKLAEDSLKGFRVAIYIPTDDVAIAADLLSQSTGIPVEMIPYSSHQEMLGWYSRARAYIGLSISDAIPTALLEAMVMGAFPIQSNTGAAEEWIRNGETGFIVHPEDPEPIAAAIRRAVTDDALVDRAAEINWQVAKERLDENIIKPRVVKIYEKIYEETHNKWNK